MRPGGRSKPWCWSHGWGRSQTGCYRRRRSDTRCCRWWRGRRRRWSRCGCRSSCRRYPNIINVFFMLAPIRIEVESGSICHITAGLIRNDRDIITYLVLVGITFERIKWIAYRHVRRPSNAPISAVGVEQLRIGIICSIAGVVPDSIEPSIGRD